MKLSNGTIAASAGIILCLAVTGCATKKHVREAIAPVQNQLNQTQSQVSTLQKQSDEAKQAIGELDRQVATADEKATDAGRKAAQAAEAAAKANAAALEAQRKADSANNAAQQAQQGVARLDTSLQNLSNYTLVSTDEVHFGIAKSTLAKEEVEKLDSMVQKLNSMKNYIIEVEGYADRTGDVASNRELSRKRADAVVHYLTVDHKIPLRVIRSIGAGSDFPDADNKTSEARKANRRVEVKIYQLDLTATAQSPAARP